MRIRRLDLLRYGHFTDASIDLPQGKTDLHVIFGPNEAGKSTAMAAIEDLLFGIPTTSPRNFLHDYAAMRIGAILDFDGKALEVRRRKGNKDTLLGANDLPLPAGDGVLAGPLGGVSREFFARMFALDHERLREGGRDIVAARDDVGQILFAAGAGIAGLRGHLTEMAEEADGLWGARRSGRRKYAQAEERLKTAEGLLRECTVTANKWQDLKTAFESSDEACLALEREINEKSAELRKLTRIRRVYRDVRKHVDIEAAIAELGAVTILPDDAAALLDAAARNDEAAATRLAALTEQIEALRTERAPLTYDDALLQREQDIAHLHERRIQVRAGKADLPKRRVELAGAEAAIRRLATDLDWQGKDIDQIIAGIPARSKVTLLRSLLGRRGVLASAVENAELAVQEAHDKASDLESQIAASQDAINTAALAAAIKVAANAGDFAARAASATRERDEADSTIRQRFQAMSPAPRDEEALVAMSIPPFEAVQQHRDAQHDLHRRIQATNDRTQTARQDLTRLQNAYQRMISEEKVVSPGDLTDAREHRDRGWSIIRRRFIEGEEVKEAEVHGFSQDKDLSEAYEAAVVQADLLADRRFENAENAARLVVMSRQIGEQQDVLSSLAEEQDRLVAEQTAFAAVWIEMWKPSGVNPLTPDAMMEFLTTRRELLELFRKRDAAQREIDLHQRDEVAAKEQICDQLNAFGVNLLALRNTPLKIVIEQASDLQKQQEQLASAKRDLQDARRKALADVERKRKIQGTAESQWAEWTAEWSAALTSAGLPADSAVDVIQSQVNITDEMRELAVRINDLRHERIDKIERDISTFDADVSALVQAVAPQLSSLDADSAVLELERLLKESARIRDVITEKDLALSGLQEKIDVSERSRREAHETIERFQRLAKVESLEALRSAIKRSDELRKLQSEYQDATDALSKDGDGFSVQQLRDECALVDLDQIAGRQQALDRDLEALRDRHIQAINKRNTDRQEFESIGGHDGAARAAADRQSALVEMGDAAAQYIRLRSATVLLQWAIERFRREKQAPLLKRAGELFAILTDGSFEALSLEFDDTDTPKLAGVRSNGDRVRLPGLSTGAGDQLYLALRIAAVEEYLEHAAPLPFVADDLFVNYDDGRSAAGLRVLGHLARKTQVLFFTHHQHLIEVARNAVGEEISTVSLSPHPAPNAVVVRAA
ncbi:MAG: AAA family ATPase [Bradyrhizobium sp.]|uniref:ATP-binding protein n=1 Tax=Bradyrhizobium sp. TaxID=376 RepID=UPI0025B8B784|nr:YhaN family protein [Bradyrhizobium sp.]MBI5263857.1 AAA family ATPase [Bradyrhizobium sp.]